MREETKNQFMIDCKRTSPYEKIMGLINEAPKLF